VSERPPQSLLWDFVRGATMTRALAVAADLRIAESLAAGPRGVEELARDAGVDADALHRLLRALASDGVFAEDEPGVFRNTEAAEVLRGEGWPEFAHLFGGVFYEAVGPLDRAVETGKPTFPETFGADFWSWLAEHDDERSRFDRAMAGGKMGTADRLAALDWREGEVVVDVGGGNGALLVALIHRRPELRGIVFDLPETERDEGALGDRIEFVEGSFFERVPPADAYLLSAILHDWDDERAGAILSTIREAAPPGARVLVLESVVPAGNEPYGAKWLDLLMLVLAGGRERTEAEWRQLLERSGLDPVRIEDGLIEARCR
jgi:O-methyltransferase domain/Dimerisation domain